MNVIIKHKWASIFAFLIFLGLSAEVVSYSGFLGSKAPTIYEVILLQTNGLHLILFPLTYILLLITAANSTEIEKENLTSIKYVLISLKTVSIYLGIFLIANILLRLIVGNIEVMFINKWTYTSELSETGLTPISSTLISICLFALRFLFIVLLVYVVNTISKTKYISCLVVIVISYIDFLAYDLGIINNSILLFPITHTMVTDVNMMRSIEVSRFSYLISFGYWALLITGVFLILRKTLNKRGAA